MVLHERLPGSPSGGAGAGDPSLVFDPASDGALPDAVRTNGEDVPAPPLLPPDAASSPEDRGELVYRAVRPEEVVRGAAQSVTPETPFDRHTQREGMLYYHAVFDPSVVPFKRNNAKDGIRADYSLEVRDARLREVELAGNRLERGRDAFWGSVLVDLAAGQPTPIPSVSPESRILGYEAAPQVALRFWKDGADNYYVQADESGRVRLNVLMDAPRRYFSESLPRGVRTSSATAGYEGPAPRIPSAARGVAEEVWREVGIRPDMTLDVVLPRLVSYFRAFVPGEPPPQSDDIYRDLALGKRGVCRHRVHAFVITAQSLGIAARYVSNEAHVFAEVWVPGDDPGWLRVDLGGGADGLTVFGGEDRRRHVPETEDPFPASGDYEDNYSFQAVEGGEGPAGATRVLGLPPRQRVTRGGAGRDGRTDDGAEGEVVRDPSLPSSLGLLSREGRIPTRLRLVTVDASVFRGETVSVAGRVTDPDGRGVGGLPVVVFLVPPAGESGARKLGGTLADGAGRFEEDLPVPRDLAVGTYRLMVQHMGDDRYAPARAE